MATWELTGVTSATRFVRFRWYTRSESVARSFARVPPTHDEGEEVVFHARRMSLCEPRHPTNLLMRQHVLAHVRLRGLPR